jgi:uracil-DNA glycosylase
MPPSRRTAQAAQAALPPAFPTEAPWTGRTEDRETLEAEMAALKAEIGADCRRCKLCEQRTNVVFGVGNPKTPLMFVGEGPGADEDQQGEPFVGKAGQLLDKIIGAMGLSRPEIYIANVVKCRPPQNRVPELDEQSICGPFLERQIELIRPQVIVTLGATPTKYLMRTDATIGQMRAKFHAYRGAELMPTYHPAYLLRSPEAKRPVWEDMQQVMAKLGLKPKA